MRDGRSSGPPGLLSRFTKDERLAEEGDHQKHKPGSDFQSCKRAYKRDGAPRKDIPGLAQRKKVLQKLHSEYAGDHSCKCEATCPDCFRYLSEHLRGDALKLLIIAA